MNINIGAKKMKDTKHQEPMINKEPRSPLSDKETFLKKYGKNMIDRGVGE